MEQTLSHQEHESYEKMQHHHVNSQRRRDHGYKEHEEGTFQQFNETKNKHDGPMSTFSQTLKRSGHASAPKEHYSVGL